jgi:predicted nucleotidyltransferase
MSRDEILARLREFEPALRERGIAHAALFGSAARGDNGPDSDIDIMVEFDPGVILSVYEYVALKNYVADLFVARVDVVNRAGLKSIIGPAITAEAVYAF